MNVGFSPAGGLQDGNGGSPHGTSAITHLLVGCLVITTFACLLETVTTLTPGAGKLDSFLMLTLIQEAVAVNNKKIRLAATSNIR